MICVDDVRLTVSHTPWTIGVAGGDGAAGGGGGAVHARARREPHQQHTRPHAAVRLVDTSVLNWFHCPTDACAHAFVERLARSLHQNIVSNNRFDASCRPYLCNLAVLPPYRGQGLGRALANHAERVVGVYWQEPVIYLHLDEVSDVLSTLCAANT